LPIPWPAVRVTGRDAQRARIVGESLAARLDLGDGGTKLRSVLW
jgi:hypothetical protein